MICILKTFSGDVKVKKYYGQWKQLMEAINRRIFVLKRCMSLTLLAHIQSI